MAPQEQRYEHASPEPREYEGRHRTDAENEARADIAIDHQDGARGWASHAIRDAQRLTEADAQADRYTEEQARWLRQDAELRAGPEMPGTDYLGHDHHELKAMVDTDLEPGQVDEAGAAWNDFGNAMVELDSALRDAVSSSETDWRGAAGDAARGFLAGLGGWAAATGRAAHLAANQFSAEAESAATARNSMPEPVEFSVSDALNRLISAPNEAAVAAAITEIEQKFNEKNEAHEQAARVMTGYAGSLQAAGSTMPAFAAPPTMDTAPQPGPPEGGRPDGGRASSPLPSGTRVPSGSPAPGSGGEPGDAPIPGDGSTSGQDAQPGSAPPSGNGPAPGAGTPRPSAVGGDGRGMVPVGAVPFAPVGAVAPGEPGRRPGGGPGSGRGLGPGGPPARGGATGGPGTGSRPPGALAAEQAALRRGGANAGGRGAGPGVAPFGAGGARKEEDTEHQRPEWLIEPDPEGTFGADELTAPAVIGVDDCSDTE